MRNVFFSFLQFLSLGLFGLLEMCHFVNIRADKDLLETFLVQTVLVTLK
jgi:hypothetical protein